MQNRYCTALAAAIIAAAPMSASSQGIPTMSAAELAQLIQIATTLKAQIEQLKTQVNALTSNRGYGVILNDPRLRSYLPSEWASIYDDVAAGKLSGLSSAAKGIQSAESLPSGSTGAGRYGFVLATNKAVTLESYRAAGLRLDNIQALMLKANETGDMKAAADLQNRLAAEQALVQAEQTRVNLAMQLQQAELRLAEEQRQREFKSGLLAN